MNKVTKDRELIFKQAVKYAKINTTLSSRETKKITTPLPKAIKELLLRIKMIEKYANEAERQS